MGMMKRMHKLNTPERVIKKKKIHNPSHGKLSGSGALSIGNAISRIS
jgi:hypothetical protein